ncbi:hypothetical protein M2275_008442, partial [Rhodococcus opacus]|nr:hypothetical protein [Rhodococcus opacus]
MSVLPVAVVGGTYQRFSSSEGLNSDNLRCGFDGCVFDWWS